jgi:hypothetical protein
MPKTLRCYLGKHQWRLRKGRRGDSEDERTYYLVSGLWQDTVPPLGGIASLHASRI